MVSVNCVECSGVSLTAANAGRCISLRIRPYHYLQAVWKLTIVFAKRVSVSGFDTCLVCCGREPISIFKTCWASVGASLVGNQHSIVSNNIKNKIPPMGPAEKFRIFVLFAGNGSWVALLRDFSISTAR